MTWNKHYYNKEYREVFRRGFVLPMVVWIHRSRRTAFLLFTYHSRPLRSLNLFKKPKTNGQSACLVYMQSPGTLHSRRLQAAGAAGEFVFFKKVLAPGVCSKYIRMSALT